MYSFAGGLVSIASLSSGHTRRQQSGVELTLFASLKLQWLLVAWSVLFSMVSMTKMPLVIEYYCNSDTSLPRNTCRPSMQGKDRWACIYSIVTILTTLHTHIHTQEKGTHLKYLGQYSYVIIFFFFQIWKFYYSSSLYNCYIYIMVAILALNYWM